ncbi:alpha/beta hydrolase, partial [Enterococcus faecium]|nr:alpha/beta hydrolase [Enterococcus faecium]
MQFLTDDHVKLVYTDEGDGQPIIFLTGYSGIKEEWYFQRNFYVTHG